MTIEEQIKPYLDKYAEIKSNQKSDNSIKRIPLEKKPAYLDFEETISGTTYIMKSFFDIKSEEDILHKVVRLMNGSKINEYKETE